MKRASRKPSNLSNSMQRHLNAYSLAASAAGVSVLSLTEPAEAKIVYTPAHHVIKANAHYNLDLMNDGITDFVIENFVSCTPCQDTLFLAARKGSFMGRGTNPDRASALRGGGTIGASRRFHSTVGDMAYATFLTQGTLNSGGPWAGVTDRYLGLRIVVNHARHYGWARLNVRINSKTAKITAVLTGYAYETIPNKPIIAGKTKGPDVITVEPGSLGALAAGVSVRRVGGR